MPLFKLGKIVATPGVNDFLSPDEVIMLLTRHAQGNWGELCEDDKAVNNEALIYSDRVLSSYTVIDPTAKAGGL